MDVKAFYKRKSVKVVTFGDALEEVRAHHDPKSVIILPPESGDTALDSDVEDIPNSLNTEDAIFEMAGEAVVEFNQSDDNDSDVESTDEEAVPVYQIQSKSKCKRRKKSDDMKRKVAVKQQAKWRKNATFSEPLSQDSQPRKVANTHQELITMSPFELWKQIFDERMMDLIFQQTLLYATRDKNEKDFILDRNEIYRFLGILLISGYHSLPNEIDYWSNQPDLGVSVVSQSMSRNRFMSIKRNLHLADNQHLESGNKAAKVQPVYDILNQNLTKFGIWDCNLSIDESMVPYFGKSSLKMFIRGKPIRFGFKLWALCAPNGYPYRLQIYTGRDANNSSEPLGTRVVKSMVEVMSNSSNVESHKLYFDNFFTSYDLLSMLKEAKVKATGTIRQYRTGGLHMILPCDKEMKKKPRGSFDYRSDGNVFIVKWHDNSIVNLASNFESHLPVRNVSRRVKGVSKTMVTQPDLVKSYNENMGGVDVMDRLLGSYRLVL